MKILNTTITDEAHSLIKNFQKKNKISNIDTAVDSIIKDYFNVEFKESEHVLELKKKCNN